MDTEENSGIQVLRYFSNVVDCMSNMVGYMAAPENATKKKTL